MDLAELERTEIEDAVSELGLPRFHGRQIFRWIHQRGVADFERMTDLARPARTRLAQTFSIGTPSVETRQTSARWHDQDAAAPERRPTDRVGVHP